jgi:hypothetical protein
LTAVIPVEGAVKGFCLSKLSIVAVALLALSGCVNGNGWSLNATVNEPIEDKCATVLFGESNCVRSEQNKENPKDHRASLVNKATGLEDPLDLVSYVGVNVGVSF